MTGAVHTGGGAERRWSVLARTALALSGAFSLLTGVAAVGSERVAFVDQGGALVMDVTTWGWVHIGLGVLAVVLSVLLGSGASWVWAAAVVLVVVDLLKQILLLPAYPPWVIAGIAVDALAFYALTVESPDFVAQ